MFPPSLFVSPSEFGLHKLRIVDEIKDSDVDLQELLLNALTHQESDRHSALKELVELASGDDAVAFFFPALALAKTFVLPLGLQHELENFSILGLWRERALAIVTCFMDQLGLPRFELQGATQSQPSGVTVTTPFGPVDVQIDPFVAVKAALANSSPYIKGMFGLALLFAKIETCNSPSVQLLMFAEYVWHYIVSDSVIVNALRNIFTATPLQGATQSGFMMPELELEGIKDLIAEVDTGLILSGATVMSKTPTGQALRDLLGLLSMSSITASSGILGDPVVARKMMKTIEANLVKDATIDSLFSYSIRFLKLFSSRVKECYDTRSLAPLFEESFDYDEIKADLVFYESPASVETPGNVIDFQSFRAKYGWKQKFWRPISMAERVERFALFEAFLTKYLASMKVVDTKRLDVIQVLARYRALLAVARRDTEGTAVRLEPFGVFFTGAPNSGKTSTAIAMVRFLAVVEDLTAPEQGMVKIQDTNYLDRFKSTDWAVLLDDLDVPKDMNRRAINPAELSVGLINTAPFEVEKARAEEKGMTMAAPLLVVACSNSLTMRMEELAAFPGAPLRRYPFRVRQSIKPAYLRQDGTGRLDVSRVGADCPFIYEVDEFSFTANPQDPYLSRFTFLTQGGLFTFLHQQYCAHFDAQRVVLRTLTSPPCRCGNPAHTGDCVVEVPSVGRAISAPTAASTTTGSSGASSRTVDRLNRLAWKGRRIASLMARNIEEAEGGEDSRFESQAGMSTHKWWVGPLVGFTTAMFTKQVWGEAWAAFLDDKSDEGCVNPFLAEILKDALVLGVAASTTTAFIAAVGSLEAAYPYHPISQGVTNENAPDIRKASRSVWTSVPVNSIRPAPSAATQSMSTEEFLRCIARRVYVARNEATGLTCNAISIGNSLFLMNRHLLMAGNTRTGLLGSVDVSLFPPAPETGYLRVCVTPEIAYAIPNKDAVVVFVRSSMSSKSIVDWFSDLKTARSFDSAFLVGSDAYMKLEGSVTPKIDYGVLSGDQTRNWTGYYSPLTRNGDCGKAFVGVSGRANAIYGIHSALDNVGNFSMAETVFSNELRMAINFFQQKQLFREPGYILPSQFSEGAQLVAPDPTKSSMVNVVLQGAEPFQLLGTLQPLPHRSKMVTKIKPSPFSELDAIRNFTSSLGADDYVPPVFGGSTDVARVKEAHRQLGMDFGDLGRDGWIDPYMIGMAKYSSPTLPFEAMRWAFHDYVGAFAPDQFANARPLSKGEAIRGIPGTSLRALPLSTSAGPPLNCLKREVIRHDDMNKSIVIRGDADQQIDEAITCVKSGCAPIFVAQACEKDELLSKLKLAGMMLRIFWNMSLCAQVLGRMYLSPLFLAFSDYPDVFETMVGIDCCNRVHVERFAERMNRFPWKIDKDFRWFDSTQGRDMCDWVKKVIGVMIEYAEYTDEEKDEALLVVDAMFATVRIVKGELVFMDFSNASGGPLTVWINSIANSLYERCMYFLACRHQGVEPRPFRNECCLSTYGDDQGQSCSDWMKDSGVLDEIPRQYSQCGVVVTPGNKSGQFVADQTLEAISFLKRKLVWNADAQTYCMAISKKTLGRMLLWYSEGFLSKVDHAAVVCNVVRTEAALHGLEFFRQVDQLLVTACSDLARSEGGRRLTVEDSPLFKKIEYSSLMATYAVGTMQPWVTSVVEEQALPEIVKTK